MYIRCSTPNDLPELLELYEDARAFMAANGCAAQWADGYPPRELIEQNIRSGNSYVCTDGADILPEPFSSHCAKNRAAAPLPTTPGRTTSHTASYTAWLSE